MNPESMRDHLTLLPGGAEGGRSAGFLNRPGWEAMPSSWLSDIPADGAPGRHHTPGLDDVPFRFSEGPPWRAKTYHVPGWYRGTDRHRVKLLRRMAKEYGRDPRMRAFVVKHVLAPAGVTFPSRQFKAQARAILSWVQGNIAYLNEPGELIQSPWQTLKVASGDCDDGSLLIAAMAESIALGNRFILGGKTSSGRSVRWAEGKPQPGGGPKYFHIFVDLGWPALKPTTWMSAESTMNVPLGHDVTRHGVPASVARGVDVSGWSGPVGVAMMPGVPVAGFDLPTLQKHGGEVLKLALVGALAQLILFLFLRSRFGTRLKKWGKKAMR